MAFLLDLKAKLDAKANRRSYAQAHKQAQVSSLLFQLALGEGATQMTNHVQHPLFETRLAVYKEEATHFHKNKKLTINFGDSLTDLARKYITDSIDGIWSISGSWHYHMSDMAEAMKPSTEGLDIGYVAVGCLGGNPLLVYQDLQKTIESSNAALNKIRSLYPNAKIIVYGLPPTYNIHVLETTYAFDASLVTWVQKDGNAVFISLKNFGSFYGLFANTRWSADGVHFSPTAARRFSKAINVAKTIPAGGILFA